MAQPTPNNYFGGNAQVLTADTNVLASVNNPAIVLRFSDFAAEGLSDASSFNDPDKVLLAIIRKARAWLTSDNSDEPGTLIGSPTKNFTSRNNQSCIAWMYDVSFFTPDTTSTDPDPDQII